MESPIEPIAQTEMELIRGRVIGNVRKLPMGSSYVIKTPKGEAKVKGTVYDINADGELVVVSGKVRYTDNARAARKCSLPAAGNMSAVAK